jgi:hypothetical protein
MKHRRASISILVLVFGIVFSTAIGGLALVAAIQHNNSVRTERFEQALGVAQSGVEYYRWHLAHDPHDFKDATTSAAPYVHKIDDAYGNTKGTFSLTIDPPASGSTITTITSTGWLDNNPDIVRTVKARFGIPSMSKFAFLHNANVWFGSGIAVHGKILSNGGIRMDGTNDSTVQSAKQTYTCGDETGCSPSANKPGVWGAGGPTALWTYPVTIVDFNSIALDFTSMKASAQSGGVYMGSSGSYGYHLIFNNAGTVTVKKVTATNNRKGWSSENNCENLYQQITAETTLGTYSLATKPILFFEDTVWVEGVVNGKATVVAAKFPLDVNNINIWIPTNITYIAKDGHSNLGIIAQNNIYFGLYVPTDFEVDAALMAQKGRIIRHNYNYSGCSTYTQATRNSLTVYGSVISNQKSYWNFGSPPSSGFTTRNITYDTTLYYVPPPYFPTQGEYEFISWEEQ